MTVGSLFGLIITVPIIQTENIVTLFIPNGGIKMEAFYNSFIVASLVEEGYKFILLYFLVWRNKNLNEPFDGIVYSVFISLGFAGIENCLYVLSPSLGGINTAITRAFISVPGHGFFGVVMGYYFAMAKFVPEKKTGFLFKAFFYTFLIHGTYDFILLSDMKYMMVFFVGFLIYLWVSGFRKIKMHIERSPFKNRSK